MKELQSLRFEVWTDGKNDTMSIRAECPESKGLKRIYFVLSRYELHDLVNGRASSAVDINHHLAVFGDIWTFYDLDLFTSATSGVLEAPFIRLTMPQIFMKAVARLCEKTWRLLRKGRKDADEVGTSQYDTPNRVQIDVDKKHRHRSCMLYGIGKGRVEIVYPERSAPFETKAEVESLRRSDADFNQRIYQLKNIALNTTRGFHQTSKLIISCSNKNDFYWTVLNPKGNRTLNGGLVNHGSSEQPDWSIHT